MTRMLSLWRIMIPTLWLGMIIALSFIEPILKFQAPGITTPLGLGIGRLTFVAMAIAGWTLLISTTLVSLRGITRGDIINLALIWVVLATQTFIVRPPLTARSDIIIAGGDPGESVLHYVYIATDVALLALLIIWVTRAVRRAAAPVPTAA
ncbi:hypothetical protein [Microbacterium sp. NC79]|uniref:hypothetical protein n=1 Tax=Microbacterium sp. NC79 TaxID=2851009 RepID=UPI001C2BD0BC|nr:hypothetical protein [Microbacterium sp. NC79]MBV0895242.1 hypothetical protein [Microbacterium sp. NC79]